MVHVMEMTNVLREDVRKQPFTRESLLEGAPARSDDSWHWFLLEWKKKSQIPGQISILPKVFGR